MMETIGTFEYDNLFAGEGAKEQMTLPVVSSVAKSDLKKGTLMAWISGASGGLTPLKIGDKTTGESPQPTEASVPFAILAEDLTGWKSDAAVDSAPVFISGVFNRDAVVIKSGTLDNDTIVAYAKIGIRLISVAK